MKWIAEITGSDEFEKAVSKIPNISDFKASDPKVWAYLQEQDREPLPSKERASAHINGKPDYVLSVKCLN
jgi:hypothetical protein